ncbi:MAG: hypothetical protein EZS28_011076 [Streblomastix strix]|uniref:Serpin domain-containing protein n=1 Tax=Streblomastix strix TaxID=222440 RepID=A0A5J4WEL4_9EUKA|nr:MAG: hypothetical protein EZS28_011076 [Streblomastix strix]
MLTLLSILVALLGGEIIQNYPTAENLYTDHVSQFGTSLLLALNNQTSQENIIISPLSIYTALIVAGSGADGKTLYEFRKVLHTCNDSRFNEEKNLLALAAKDTIDIDVKKLNLQLKNENHEVNSYVEKETKGLIKNILPGIDPNDKMMYTGLDDIYKTPESFKQAALKYLSAEGLRKIKANGNNTKVHLSLPKFETRFKISLLKSLKAIGLDQAFTDNAEFLHISNDSLKISDVIHEVEVKIDEDGAEAVAVTRYEMFETSFDRPFLVAFYDTHSHMPIFTEMIKTVGNAVVEAEMKVGL